jgi:hypothetical protein
MISAFYGRLKDAFAERFDRWPFATVNDLVRFASTRAAYVAQTSLYGYLKTRMGTSFQRHFEDETFSGVIRASAVKLFAPCLADLVVFSVATARAGGGLSDAECAALAQRCYAEALGQGVAETDLEHLPADAAASFEARIALMDWDKAAEGENAFRGSAAALIECAPVIDEYKKLDAEIVTNSIRFRWRDVREVGRRRIDGAALAEDWRRNGV